MPFCLLLSLLVLARLVGAQDRLANARGPAFARDGRLVVSIDGDLWLRSGEGDLAGARWRQLTRGSAWDRDAAWTADDAALVYVSNAAGDNDLWRLTITDSPAPLVPVRLTRSPDPDGDPAPLPDGGIVFVRGEGRGARLWQLDTSGNARRLTSGENTERWPAVTATGDRIAYVQISDEGRRLRVREFATQRDSTIVGDRNPEWPAWSPDGARIAFSSAGSRGGIFITDSSGRYVNLVSTTRGEPAWEPGGRRIVVAERTAEEPGYNGDPARMRDREAAEVIGLKDRLLTIAAPAPPDADVASTGAPNVSDRATRNRELYDRAWQRVERLYLSTPAAAPRAAQLRALAQRYSAAARAAPDDDSLERILHSALGTHRPAYGAEVSGRSAVSSAHPVATAAGLETLRRGGNAVDAAVAVSFTLGVLEPDASGIGGYGEMLVHRAGALQPAVIEFMARAPEEASLANATLLVNGRYPGDGPMLPMVPGTVAGMYSAWQRFGSKLIPWAELLQPAIRAAKAGFVVSDGFATTLNVEQHRYAKYESSRALFFRNGKPLVAGDTLRNPDLAWTLEQIAAKGADGFYRGEVARRMVEDLRGKGNAIRLTDMMRYFAADREPVSTTYRGYTMYSSAPPASGGSTLAAQLNLFERFAAPKNYVEDAPTLHAMIAAWQLVPSARGRLSDPSLWPTNTAAFTNKDSARVRWRCFDPSRALDPRVLQGDTLKCGGAANASSGARGEGDMPNEPASADALAEERPQGTTAFVIADSSGNVVSVTQTLGTWGGNFYVTPGLGFLYNDKLTSYGTDPAAYGARLPFARHGSSIAPTIVYSGTGSERVPRLAIGAAGNAWITAAVYQGIAGMLDFGLGPQQALELPRFLPSSRSAADGVTTVDIEDGLAPGVMRELQRLGYRINRISLKGELRMGYGAALLIDGGRVRAGADPRRDG
ncbi:MAG: gamma-glutamyltransferase, partial [Gemmatimonadaceae bacterium]